MLESLANTLHIRSYSAHYAALSINEERQKKHYMAMVVSGIAIGSGDA